MLGDSYAPSNRLQPCAVGSVTHYDQMDRNITVSAGSYRLQQFIDSLFSLQPTDIQHPKRLAGVLGDWDGFYLSPLSDAVRDNSDRDILEAIDEDLGSGLRWGREEICHQNPFPNPSPNPVRQQL